MNTIEPAPKPPSQKLRFSFRRKSKIEKNSKQMAADRACADLALKGEQLCRQEKWEEGVDCLESAIRLGTSDLKTLSAAYSQLGNAYFNFQDYHTALEYHQQDLSVARTMCDKLGEAKACSNIGSTLKALNQFDEAVACYRIHLDISRELQDKVMESRALYNLGNVYHARGKHVSTAGAGYNQDVEDNVRSSLEQAARYYEANLKLVRDFGDQLAQGKTIGNLANTYYLLGNFKKAIKYHEERLTLAQSLNDLQAVRRALSNLGNAHVFLGKYSTAAQHYQSALSVAKEMKDEAFEAQSCYSLGNTYTLMEDFELAKEYHQRHLEYAVQLGDRVGETRAYWSLGNVYSSLGDHHRALQYANRHLELAKMLGDYEGMQTATQNIEDLVNILELSTKFECTRPPSRPSSRPPSRPHSLKKTKSTDYLHSNTSSFGKSGGKKQTRSVSTVSADHTRPQSVSHAVVPPSPDSGVEQLSPHNPSPVLRKGETGIEDSFFDILTKVQGQRMDDQRTSLPPLDEKARSSSLAEDDDLFDVLCRIQGARLNDQRAVLPPHSMSASEDDAGGENVQEDVFAQEPHLNDARPRDPAACRRSTMPSEDFFNLIQHLQSTRIEDQRSPLPVPLVAN